MVIELVRPRHHCHTLTEQPATLRHFRSFRRGYRLTSETGTNLGDVKAARRCSRPGCDRSAVATLTYVYAESTAVVGPLAVFSEPHSYDLCEDHACRLTVPRGWEVLRSEGDFNDPGPSTDDLLALADAVREAARPDPDLISQPVPRRGPMISGKGRRGHLRVIPHGGGG